MCLAAGGEGGGGHPQRGGRSEPGTHTLLSGQAGFLPMPSAKLKDREGRGGEAGRGERRQEELWALALECFPAVETPAPTPTGTSTLARVLGKRTPAPPSGNSLEMGSARFSGPTQTARG